MAAASRRQVILVGPEKRVGRAGRDRGPIPVELIPIPEGLVRAALQGAGARPALRAGAGGAAVRQRQRQPASSTVVWDAARRRARGARVRGGDSRHPGRRRHGLFWGRPSGCWSGTGRKSATSEPVRDDMSTAKVKSDRTLSSREAVTRRRRTRWSPRRRAAIAARGRFSRAGGGWNTEGAVQLLAAPAFAPRIDWTRACTCSGATSGACRPDDPAATTAWRARRCWTASRSRPRPSTASAAKRSRRGGGRLRTGRPAGDLFPAARRASTGAAGHGRQRPHGVAVPAPDGGARGGALGGRRVRRRGVDVAHHHDARRC